MSVGAILCLALGLFLTLEGLVLALAPGRVEEILEFLRRLPHETRRNIGLAGVALGVAFLWAARSLMG